MKGKDFYYSEISKLLLDCSPQLAKAFDEIAAHRSGREVYFWLVDKDKSKQLCNKVKMLMSDFYWELF